MLGQAAFSGGCSSGLNAFLSCMTFTPPYPFASFLDGPLDVRFIERLFHRIAQPGWIKTSSR